MAKVNNKEAAVARVYAEALMSAAGKADAIDTVRDELLFLARRAEEDEAFARFVQSPLIDPDDRRASIERMFRGKLTDTTVDGLQVLNRKGRLEILASVAELYRRELMERRGEVEVDVWTAIPIDEATRDKIRAAAKRYTGREPILQEHVDEDLVGGIVLQVGDRKIDASVQHEIEKYRRRLEARASYELIAGRRVVADAAAT